SNFPQVLISKTIDNDIGKVIVEGKNIKVINYFTLGFPTGAEKISSIVSLKNGLRTTAYSHERIIIVEAMGMHAGWLALASGMGNPDFILIPEFPINYDNLLEKIIDKYEKKKNLIIVIAEGSIWENGAYVCAKDDEENYIIHPRFGGAAQVLKVKLKNDLKKYFNTRNINAVNPSYIYRSGSSNKIDFYWAKNLGEKAVEVLASGLNESIFLFIQIEQNNFFIHTFSLKEFKSIKEIHRYVEKSFYNPYEYKITEQGKLYLKKIIKEIPEYFNYGV
ncbi:MAG: 6-phosphofructokinase, partial [Promethearchaeota archaeon]